MKAAVDLAIAHFRSLDIVVNNAGLLAPVHRLADFTPKNWDQVNDVNVKGFFYMMHAARPTMIAQGGGIILNIHLVLPMVCWMVGAIIVLPKRRYCS